TGEGAVGEGGGIRGGPDLLKKKDNEVLHREDLLDRALVIGGHITRAARPQGRRAALMTWRAASASRCSASFCFFTSRRRHTRSLCDWSSDVCSSDLRTPCSASASRTSRSSQKQSRDNN